MNRSASALIVVVALLLGCSSKDALPSVGGNALGQMTTMRLAAADGVTYDALGRPVDGDAAALVPLPGYNQFWFAWSVFNHGSAVFGGDAVSTAPIADGGDCAVPCDELRLGCSGKDCIPALTAPSQVAQGSGEASYVSNATFVVGVEVGGEARAYPHNILWWHEIVNDVVGGRPIAITHCPLTFSTLAYDPTAFTAGQTVELGVSGRLFNSNLVFYDRATDSYYSQLLGKGTTGPALGTPSPQVAVYEMSWAAWKALHPSTTLLSGDTGHARDYERYPYDDYFTDHANTFSVTNPAPDAAYPNKTLTYGLRIDGAAKAYAHPELAAWAQRTYGDGAPPAGVVMDDVGGRRVAIVFDVDAGYVQAFDRTGLPDLELVR